MGFYTDQALPRVMDWVMRNREFRPIRARVAGGLSGEVLEVGFGSGLNVRYYPQAVTKILAIEPSTVSRNIAVSRVAASSVPVEYAGLDGQSIPLAEGSVDSVLSTWTLCTIPDVEGALREIRRVLRSGGSFRFVEHGRSPDLNVARWQDRLTPIQRRVAGGCHLNRPIADLIKGSGLELTQMSNYYIRGPRAQGYLFEGAAIKN